MKVNGGVAVWEESIDSAIGKMTNEAGRYEIILYPESKSTVKMGGVVYPYDASFGVALPTVAGLKFTGVKHDLNAKQYWLANLSSTKPLVLQSALVLENLKLTASSITANRFSISKIGEVRLETERL